MSETLQADQQNFIVGQSGLKIPNLQAAEVDGIDDINDFFEKVYDLNSDQYETTSTRIAKHKQRELVVPATEKKPLYIFRSDYTGDEVVEQNDSREPSAVRHMLLTPPGHLGSFEKILSYYNIYVHTDNSPSGHKQASFLGDIFELQSFLQNRGDLGLSSEDMKNYGHMYLQKSARYALSQTVKLLLPS
jgi:hypothetical protein